MGGASAARSRSVSPRGRRSPSRRSRPPAASKDKRGKKSSGSSPRSSHRERKPHRSPSLSPSPASAGHRERHHHRDSRRKHYSKSQDYSAGSGNSSSSSSGSGCGSGSSRRADFGREERNGERRQRENTQEGRVDHRSNCRSRRSRSRSRPSRSSKNARSSSRGEEEARLDHLRGEGGGSSTVRRRSSYRSSGDSGHSSSSSSAGPRNGGSGGADHRRSSRHSRERWRSRSGSSRPLSSLSPSGSHDSTTRTRGKSGRRSCGREEEEASPAASRSRSSSAGSRRRRKKLRDRSTEFRPEEARQQEHDSSSTHTHAAAASAESSYAKRDRRTTTPPVAASESSVRSSSSGSIPRGNNSSSSTSHGSSGSSTNNSKRSKDSDRSGSSKSSTSESSCSLGAAVGIVEQRRKARWDSLRSLAASDGSTSSPAASAADGMASEALTCGSSSVSSSSNSSKSSSAGASTGKSSGSSGSAPGGGSSSGSRGEGQETCEKKETVASGSDAGGLQGKLSRLERFRALQQQQLQQQQHQKEEGAVPAAIRTGEKSEGLPFITPSKSAGGAAVAGGATVGASGANVSFFKRSATAASAAGPAAVASSENNSSGKAGGEAAAAAAKQQAKVGKILRSAGVAAGAGEAPTSAAAAAAAAAAAVAAAAARATAAARSMQQAKAGQQQQQQQATAGGVAVKRDEDAAAGASGAPDNAANCLEKRVTGPQSERADGAAVSRGRQQPAAADGKKDSERAGAAPAVSTKKPMSKLKARRQQQLQLLRSLEGRVDLFTNSAEDSLDAFMQTLEAEAKEELEAAKEEEQGKVAALRCLTVGDAAAKEKKSTAAAAAAENVDGGAAGEGFAAVAPQTISLEEIARWSEVEHQFLPAAAATAAASSSTAGGSGSGSSSTVSSSDSKGPSAVTQEETAATLEAAPGGSSDSSSARKSSGSSAGGDRETSDSKKEDSRAGRAPASRGDVQSAASAGDAEAVSNKESAAVAAFATVQVKTEREPEAAPRCGSNRLDDGDAAGAADAGDAGKGRPAAVATKGEAERAAVKGEGGEDTCRATVADAGEGAGSSVFGEKKLPGAEEKGKQQEAEDDDEYYKLFIESLRKRTAAADEKALAETKKAAELAATGAGEGAAGGRESNSCQERRKRRRAKGQQQGRTGLEDEEGGEEEERVFSDGGGDTESSSSSEEDDEEGGEENGEGEKKKKKKGGGGEAEEDLSYFDLLLKVGTKKQLPTVDHAASEYPEIRKNIYVQVKEITNMKDHEVEALRKTHGNIRVRGKQCPRPIKSFYQCGLPDRILRYLTLRGITEPFPIQMQAIPCLMCGRDVIAVAETGSGKTLAYALPLLRHVLSVKQQYKAHAVNQKLQRQLQEQAPHGGQQEQNGGANTSSSCGSTSAAGGAPGGGASGVTDLQRTAAAGGKAGTKTGEKDNAAQALQKKDSKEKVIVYKGDFKEGMIALVIAPTRELTLQIFKEINRCCRLVQLSAVACYGGAGIGSQLGAIKRGVDVVVGTPGRLIDILTMNAGRLTSLKRVTFIVLDEADRMFDFGFEPQVTSIIASTRPDRQTCMFSATFPPHIEALARRILRKPVEIIVGEKGRTASTVQQYVEVMEEDAKFIRLLQLLGEWQEHGSIIIFVNRQVEADELFTELLKYGYPSATLHGGQDQTDREFTIHEFQDGEQPLLIATSVAARGLDCKHCVLVVNMTCPNHLEDYVHRIGRTGRAGRIGVAYTFLTKEDADKAEELEKALIQSGQQVPPALSELAAQYRQECNMGMHEQQKKKRGGFGGRGFSFSASEKSRQQQERQQAKKELGIEKDETEEEYVDAELLTPEDVLGPAQPPSASVGAGGTGFAGVFGAVGTANPLGASSLLPTPAVSEKDFRDPASIQSAVAAAAAKAAMLAQRQGANAGAAPGTQEGAERARMVAELLRRQDEDRLRPAQPPPPPGTPPTGDKLHLPIVEQAEKMAQNAVQQIADPAERARHFTAVKQSLINYLTATRANAAKAPVGAAAAVGGIGAGQQQQQQLAVAAAAATAAAAAAAGGGGGGEVAEAASQALELLKHGVYSQSANVALQTNLEKLKSMAVLPGRAAVVKEKHYLRLYKQIENHTAQSVAAALAVLSPANATLGKIRGLSEKGYKDPTTGNFVDEFEINDYPQVARYKFTQKDVLNRLMEETGAVLYVKGQHVEPKEKNRIKLAPGVKYLHVEIIGSTPIIVQRARSEVRQLLEALAVRSLNTSNTQVARSITGRYNIWT